VRDFRRAQTIMVSHIQGCVEHALKEDNAGVFGASPQLAKTAPATAGKKIGKPGAK
jgi:hypothetical protein